MQRGSCERPSRPTTTANPPKRTRHARKLQTQTRGLLPSARRRPPDGGVLGLRTVRKADRRRTGGLAPRGRDTRRARLLRPADPEKQPPPAAGGEPPPRPE